MQRVATDAQHWFDRYAEALGVPPPGDDEVASLLELASIAAHASERLAAPVSCWLVARSGLTPAEALARARDVAGELD